MGLISRTKNNSLPLLKQIIDLIPINIINSAVAKFNTDKHCRTYKTYDQFVAMLFGQLNNCLTLRDISLGLGINSIFISDMGLEQNPAKSTMSDSHKKRDWRVFEDIFFQTIGYYGNVFKNSPTYKAIDEIKDKSVKLIDSTTISVCLRMFNWAKFRTAKGGIKIHTCLDEAKMIPTMVNITEAKTHDRNGVNDFVFPENTIIVEDRGYYDFKLFKMRHTNKNFFVTRIKENAVYEIVEELDLTDEDGDHILIDEVIKFSSAKAIEAGLDQIPIRRIAIYKEDDDKTIVVISNNLEWSASTIAELYKRRWKIEIFFKALKQNLQIKTFIGTSANACKSQIYIALIAYYLLELIRRSISKVKHTFSQFVNLIRICIGHYHSLKYVVNEIKPISQKAKKYGAVGICTQGTGPPDSEQMDLFS
jgi:hypothetical protein